MSFFFSFSHGVLEGYQCERGPKSQDDIQRGGTVCLHPTKEAEIYLVFVFISFCSVYFLFSIKRARFGMKSKGRGGTSEAWLREDDVHECYAWRPERSESSSS